MNPKRVKNFDDDIKKIEYPFRWSAYILGSIAYMFTIFHRVNVAVLAPYILETFKASAGALGFTSGIYFYVYSFSQPVIGILVDKLKPRKVLTLAVLIMSLGTFIFAYSPSLPFIYLGRFLIGAGCAGIFIPVNWIVNRYFAFEKRGFLFFIFQFVGNIASVLAAAPFAKFLNLFGWKDALISIAFIPTAVGFLIWVILRDNNSKKKEFTLDKENTEDTIKSSEEKASWIFILKKVLSISIIKYCLIINIAYGALLSFQGLWVVPYLIDVYKIGKSSAFSLVTLIPLGFIIGILLFSKLSDTLHGKYIYFFSNILIAIIYLSFTIFIQNIPHNFLIFLLFILGFSYGTFPYFLKIYSLVLPERYYGTALGILNVVPFIVAAIYQSLSGLLFDTFGGTNILYRSVVSYRIYFLFLTVSLIITSLAIFKIIKILKEDYQDMI
ncbi:putative sulfoacetate transporter SauU [subsurface metagenome]